MVKKWTLSESIKRTKLLTENIGTEMMSSLDDEPSRPKATSTDYNDLLDCLEVYEIDEDIMDNARVFVNVQMSTLGIDDDNPEYYTLKMGLIAYNLSKNGYDVYNRESEEPSTCVRDRMNEFGIGESAIPNASAAVNAK